MSNHRARSPNSLAHRPEGDVGVALRQQLLLQVDPEAKRDVFEISITKIVPSELIARAGIIRVTTKEDDLLDSAGKAAANDVRARREPVPEVGVLEVAFVEEYIAEAAADPGTMEAATSENRFPVGKRKPLEPDAGEVAVDELAAVRAEGPQPKLGKVHSLSGHAL